MCSCEQVVIFTSQACCIVPLTQLRTTRKARKGSLKQMREFRHTDTLAVNFKKMSSGCHLAKRETNLHGGNVGEKF